MTDVEDPVDGDKEGEVLVLNESDLTPEQKQILDEFRAKQERKVPKEEIDKWFEEMMDITPELLPAFIDKITNFEHSNDSIIAGAAVIALASVKSFNRVNMFQNKDQGLKVANIIYSIMSGIGDDPFRVYEFYSILDPSCDGQINSMPPQIFASLRNKAKELLENRQDAPEYLKKRWKQVMQGKLPEPWVVREIR